MDFVQIAYTGSNGMTGGTLLPSPIMKMQIGIPRNGRCELYLNMAMIQPLSCMRWSWTTPGICPHYTIDSKRRINRKKSHPPFGGEGLAEQAGLCLHFQHHQLFHRLAVYQMLFHDARNIVCRHIVVPDAVRVDDNKRSVAA